MAREHWKLGAELVRIWVPIVVSLSAISLTLFQANATRRHARLSVQPRVEWRIAEDATAGTLALTLVNEGFGPAVVRGITFLVDGKPIPATDLDACLEVARRVGRESGDAWDSHCFVSPGEYVLGSNDSVELFASFPTRPHAAEDHSAALVDYRRFAVAAEYCSFYDECWQVRTR